MGKSYADSAARSEEAGGRGERAGRRRRERETGERSARTTRDFHSYY